VVFFFSSLAICPGSGATIFFIEKMCNFDIFPGSDFFLLGLWVPAVQPKELGAIHFHASCGALEIMDIVHFY
jgi:hypothetical protein